MNASPPNSPLVESNIVPSIWRVAQPVSKSTDEEKHPVSPATNSPTQNKLFKFFRRKYGFKNSCMLNYFNNPRMAEVVCKIIQHFIPIRQTGIYADLDSSFSFVKILA